MFHLDDSTSGVLGTFHGTSLGKLEADRDRDRDWSREMETFIQQPASAGSVLRAQRQRQQ